MQFVNGAELLGICGERKIPISRAMLEREETLLGKSGAFEEMRKTYGVMRSSVEGAVESAPKTIGGLIGGEARKIIGRGLKAPVCGALMAKASAYAMGVLEVNASMGVIAAAPTAGSSGVIPGTFVAVEEEYGFTEEQMVTALFNAGAVGYLITRNATVAGAQGGCQAEVGSASAMAASALTELFGGTPEQCLHAASVAISNLLGLVCDPVAGLVQVPCQSRNALGAANAMICAQAALSGIFSRIPFDEMVSAMLDVGRRIPFELRESSLGGTAATPSACALCRGIFG